MYSLRYLTPAVAALFLSAPTPTNAQMSESGMEIIGHYYLQGVMETGSELMLMPDGRFQWYISYGAVDQNAEGTWSRSGNIVTLTAKGADRSKPLFRLDEQMDWDASMERQLLERERDARVAEVEKACPLLEGAAMASSPMMLPDGAADKAALKAKADAATIAEQRARTAGEAAAADAIAKLADPGSEERLEAARKARDDWYSARYDLENAYSLAGLSPPARTEIRLPALCTYPPDVRVDSDHPDLWKGGIVIGIADPEMGVAPKGVNVTLIWADGHKMTAKTASRGWAVFPKRAGVKANHVAIDPSFAPWGRAEFDFPALEKGLQAFVMDARQVTAAPFETMALRVEGKDLVPENLGRGRYVQEGRR